MEKVYRATVRSRNRLTVPFDCWMDAANKDGNLVLTYHDAKMNVMGGTYFWRNGKGLTKNASYRVTVNWPEGTKLLLMPNRKTGKVVLVEEIFQEI